MKNWPGHAGLERAALDPDERVRPDRLDAGDRRAAHDAARSASGSGRAAWRSCSETRLLGARVRDRVDRGARDGERRDARDARRRPPPRGSRSRRGGRSGPAGVLTTRSTPRLRTSSTTAAPFSTALDRDPGERRAPPRCRRSRRARTRARRAPARPGATATLSASRTLRNARPPAGSARPAARSAFANAVAKSAPLAITSPVERISGPSTGSAPGKRDERQHGRLDVVAGAGRALGRQVELGERGARGEAAGGVDEVDAGRLRGERHGARGARVDLEHVDLAAARSRAGR